MWETKADEYLYFKKILKCAWQIDTTIDWTFSQKQQSILIGAKQ